MWTNRLLDEMDRLFGPMNFEGPSTPAASLPYPPLAIWEDADHLYVEAELPGLSREQIDVSVMGGDTLTITGERRPQVPEKATCLRQECPYGRFTRTLMLPTLVNPEAIEATYEAGILRLTLPKHETVKPKKIPVKAADYPALTEGTK